MVSAERPAESTGKPELVGENTMPVPGLVLGVRPSVVRYNRGQTLGRYVVLDELGTGGMSVVYAAYDPKLDRRVAIKVLLAEDVAANETSDGTSASVGSRLRREAQALAKLSHPNVLPVFDVGTIDGRVFLAMEHVDGCTLAQWLKAESRPRREVVAKFVEAGRGLAAAHAAGLIHRDFKPHNVLVGKDGAVRVMDFGLARRSDDEAAEPRDEASADPARDSSRDPPTGPSVLADDFTVSGTVLGTPAYMAPEQHRAASVDARADQYAFCAALYQGLYGVAPFPGGPNKQVLLRKMKLQFQPLPPGAERGVPRWLRKVVLRGLEPNPERRWSSMQQLLVRLEKDPRKTIAKSLAASLGLGLALGGGWAYGQAQEQQAALCSGAPEKLEGVWDSQMQTRIEQAFVATRLNYAEDTWQRVKVALDAYTTKWTGHYRDACEATHVRNEQSEAALDLRMACLAGRLRQLEATARMFGSADGQIVQHATKAVGALPSIDECSNLDTLQRGPAPPPDEQRERVDALRERLATVVALEHAGKYGEALPLAQSIFANAKQLDYEPFVAESQFALGMILDRVGRFEEAADNLTQASWMAEGHRQDDLAARSQTYLVMVVGYALRQLEDALRWGRHAAAMVGRLESGELRKAELIRALASAYYGNGKLEESRVYFEQQLELLLRVLDPKDALVGAVYNNLGAVATAQHRTDAAIEYFRQTQVVYEQNYGPNHPRMGILFINVGLVLVTAGEYTQATAELRKAIHILVQSLGPDYTHVADAKQGLAEATARLGDLDGAASLYREASEIQKKALGLAHPSLMDPLFSLCSTLIAAEHLDEARRTIDEASALVHASWSTNMGMLARLSVAKSQLHLAEQRPLDAVRELEQTLAAVERQDDFDPAVVFRLRVQLGTALRAAERAKAAVMMLKRALALPAGEKPGDQAEARFELAQALLDAGEDSAVIQAVAQQALADYDSDGKAFADKRDEVQRWIAKVLDRQP